MKKLLILAFAFTFLLASCLPSQTVTVNSETGEVVSTPSEMQDDDVNGDIASDEGMLDEESAEETMDSDKPDAESPSGNEQSEDLPVLVEGGVPPTGAENEFFTDFSLTTVVFDEFLSGGIAKDGIPALDAPIFVSISDAQEWLTNTEPVVVIEVDGIAKAYPIQILTWHEIVNDEVNGLPVSVTFCPLCNSTLAFVRELDGVTYDFGTTGRLRNSNLVMYDRQTESWWQQATGEALVGELVGNTLERISAPMTSFAAFQENYPEGQVLSTETGFTRDYGRNPYDGYDMSGSIPFLFDGEFSDELEPIEHVLGVEVNDAATAYAFTLLEEEIVINDTVAGVPVVVFWQPGTNTALGAGVIANAADIGSANAFERTLDGQELTFSEMDGVIFDMETGTTWDIFGNAIKGGLEGERLMPVTSSNHFWFSWHSFRPDTAVYGLEMMQEASATVEPGAVMVDYDFPIEPYQGFDIDAPALTDVFQDGKPTVLNFFASGCPICVVEMDYLRDAHAEFGDSVNFVAVDVGPYVGLGTNDGAVLLLAEKGITFPAGNTPDIQVLREYNVLGTPTTVFFNSDGSISERYTGLLSYDQFAAFISALN